MQRRLRQDDDVRAARAADLPLLAAIEIAAATRFRGSGIDGAFLGETQSIDDLAAAADEGRLWVATHAGCCVGFALARRLDDGGAWLEEVDVHPEHGGRGLGRALVHRTIAWAREAGSASIELSTFRDVPWNAPFYARLGFRELAPTELAPAVARIVDEERARGLPTGRRLVMRLSLATAGTEV